MNFANFLLREKLKNTNQIFIEKKLRYCDLHNRVKNNYHKYFLQFKKKLIALCIENSEEFLIFYLSIINSGNTVVILERGLSEEKYLEYLDKFKIDLFITRYKFSNTKYKGEEIPKDKFVKKKVFLFKRKNAKTLDKNIYKNVAVVLLTSGSTGEKKGVMLTHKNLISNTNSILKILPINNREIVNLLLPASYSFGLSVINTHIKVGAKIYIHDSPFIGSIINELKKYKCTSFYGVPSTFEILLKKTDFVKKNFKYLKYIAQAGGHLHNNYKKIIMSKYMKSFYIMYGATEASPRLSYVPPNRLKDKLNSIGIPLPGVKFKLFKVKNSKYFQLGASGNNIMKGYFNEKKLTKESMYNKFFLTGDLAYKDDQNFYYLIKRIDKTLKRFGFKINLSLIENNLKKSIYIKNCKMYLDNESKLTLIIQTPIKVFENKIKSEVNILLRKNFASYEIPDRIIFTKQNIISYNKNGH